MQNIYQAKGTTLSEQYFDLGRLFLQEIQNSVETIRKKRSRAYKIRRLVAERSLANLMGKAICLEFFTCFGAWTSGAQISLAEGMWLLADNLSGCQTMIARYKNGVALLHTEEEFRDANHIDLHMSEPYIVSIEENGARSMTLVYNNLLPGCGLYGWRDGMIIAVDSLFLREDGIDQVDNPVLANVISWLIWRMPKDEVTPTRITELVCELGELIDGYAINIVKRSNGKADGFKVTLARGEAHSEILGDELGSFICQANIIDPKYPRMKWALPPKRIWRGGYRYFCNRYKTMDKHAKMYGKYASMTISPDMVENAHNNIQRVLFADLAESYVSADLGAICVGLVDMDTTSVSYRRSNNATIGLNVVKSTDDSAAAIQNT